MPDPCEYNDRNEFVSACISERQRENPDEEVPQSIAICNSMWRERDCSSSRAAVARTSILHKNAAVTEVRDREAVFRASSASPDRAGDIVEQNWDFKAFRQNPVLLFDHPTSPFSSSSPLPVGRVAEIWTDGDTYARAEAPPAGTDDFADKIWTFIAEKFLSAVSVGFLPLDMPVAILDATGRQTGWRYPRNELLELSVVAVPMHPDAVAVARSLGMNKAQISRIFQAPSKHRMARRRAEIERLRVC